MSGQRQNFWSLLKIEWKRSLWEERKKYGFVFALGILYFLWGLRNTYFIKNSTGAFQMIGFFDYILGLFGGTVDQMPDPFWILTMIVFCYTISTHFSDKVKTYENQIQIRTGNRKVWWQVKCAWSVLNALLFYGIIAGESAIFSLITKSGLYLRQEGNEGIYGWLIPIEKLNTKEQWIACCIAPLTALISIGLIQTFLHFIFQDKMMMVIMIVWMFLSCFIKSLLMIGNWGMIVRNNLMTQNGFKVAGIFLIEMIVCIGIIWAGRKIAEENLR